MGKRHWPIIVALILAVLWLQAEVDRWQLRREIKSVYLGNIIVQTIDAETKTPIPVTFFGPTLGDQRWPKAFTMSGTDDSSKMAIRWIDIGDVNVSVSAEGYKPVPLALSAATPRELVVPLRRSGHTD